MRPAILCLFALTTLLAQADPSALGPLPVASQDYKFAGIPIPTAAYPIDIWGTVWYPEGLPRGPYPFVALHHSNLGICRVAGTQVDFGTTTLPPNCPAGQIQTPNHSGYEYIAQRLASHGYIVASVNANAINVRSNGNPERGHAVLEHLRYWQLWNSPEGPLPSASFSPAR
jgi:hypothetical protein